MRNGRPVLCVRLRTLHERMPRELFPHRLPEHAGPTPVHDPHLAEPRERSLVDEPPRLEPCLVGWPPAHVDLVGDIAARGRSNLDGRPAVLRYALARRPQPRKRDAYPLPSSTRHLRFVPAD